MTRLLASMMLPALLFAAGGAAGAQTLASAVAGDAFFEHQVGTLERLGYHAVRATGDAVNRVTATDAQGSRVIVTFNPDQGTIVRVDYLHFADE